MHILVVSILGTLAFLLFLDGIATAFSTHHYQRRQKFFGMAVKAPSHLDEKTYNLINRMFAAMSSIAAGSVAIYWTYQYLSTLI